MGCASKYRMNELRYLAKSFRYTDGSNLLSLRRTLSEGWIELPMCDSLNLLRETESQMWNFNQFTCGSGFPPQQCVLPCSWAIEEADCLGSTDDDYAERYQLIEQLSCLHLACFRSVYEGTRPDSSYNDRYEYVFLHLFIIDILAGKDGSVCYTNKRKICYH